jgi:hypothetical protein
LGGKGSGRPKESYKPLSEIFRGIHDDIEDLEREFAERTNALQAKVHYHFIKHKQLELKRKKRRA